MFELRWLIKKSDYPGPRDKVLQSRYLAGKKRKHRLDEYTRRLRTTLVEVWSEWKEVPVIDELYEKDEKEPRR
jgi:hypothetical protein